MNNCIKIGVCDDHIEIHEQIKLLLKEYQKTNHIEFEIFCFSTAEAIRQNEEILDLLYLDIELGAESGIDLVPDLKKQFPEMKIVFISAYNQYFIFSHRLQVFQFLTKPFDKKIFFEELDRFIAKLKQKFAVYTLTYKREQMEFLISEILYIEASLHHLKIYHIHAGIYEKVGRIGKEETYLSAYGFIRCHQSYLVNCKYIEKLTKTTIEIKKPISGEIITIPISQNRSKSTKTQYHIWLLNQEE